MTDTKKIGVFPAAGGLGLSTVKHLLTLVPASTLVLLARKPDKLAAERVQGAAVRRADYDDDDASFQHVFDGIDVLFLISYASCEHEHRSQAHRKAIDAALHSGVKHIFYSSLAFAGDLGSQTAALVMRAHLETEAYLQELEQARPDFSYTVIREGLYHESFPIYTAFFDPDSPVDEIMIPHDGSGPGVAWAKREELGEATARLIAEYAANPLEYPHTNKKLLLSGPTVLTLRQVVDILNRIIGKNVTIKGVSVDEYAALPQVGWRLTYRGVDLSREWATAWQAIRDGECAVVTPLLRQTLGREPEDFETTIRGILAEGRQELQL